MVLTTILVEWSSVTLVNGELFVVLTLINKMLQSHVDWQGLTEIVSYKYYVDSEIMEVYIQRQNFKMLQASLLKLI